MKDFAALIRKGLESGVREDKLTWGIDEEKGVRSANVIGLALIGKMGLERAMSLIERAAEEAFLEDGGSATDEITKELGISLDQCEALVAIHFHTTAANIATNLENGATIDPA